ncbi:hypothetical protein XENOCAPTIV_028537 [Xenoophorus captivus]|uniref:Uncharacterized protein n=1 Tax=Xenoophorus captivus TaxID=1517983 RepID=A0ABV0RMS0_9TELE
MAVPSPSWTRRTFISHSPMLYTTECFRFRSVRIQSYFYLQHCMELGSIFSLQQDGPGFDSEPGMFLLGVCMFSLCKCGFSLGTLASSHRKVIFLLTVIWLFIVVLE